MAVQSVQVYFQSARLDQKFIFTIFSGNLYHNGELPLSLPSFTQGDYITAVLDMDARTLSFGKNGEEPRLAFEDIDSMELYPCVMFYSNSPGEKVRLLISIFERGIMNIK